MTIINIYDHATGENIEREMNADELANMQLIQKENADQEKEFIERKKLREALLVKMGITADEAALLLG